jgi:hypothetical protein
MTAVSHEFFDFTSADTAGQNIVAEFEAEQTEIRQAFYSVQPKRVM